MTLALGAVVAVFVLMLLREAWARTTWPSHRGRYWRTDSRASHLYRK